MAAFAGLTIAASSAATGLLALAAFATAAGTLAIAMCAIAAVLALATGSVDTLQLFNLEITHVITP
jgi:hypothetical protein